MDMNMQQLECLAPLPLRMPTIANFGVCGPNSYANMLLDIGYNVFFKSR